jgi:hypothetical protein
MPRPFNIKMHILEIFTFLLDIIDYTSLFVYDF